MKSESCGSYGDSTHHIRFYWLLFEPLPILIKSEQPRFRDILPFLPPFLCSLFLVLRSLFVVLSSLILGTLFSVLCSFFLFFVLSSLASVLCSLFSVLCSPFSVLRSLFFIICSLFFCSFFSVLFPLFLLLIYLCFLSLCLSSEIISMLCAGIGRRDAAAAAVRPSHQAEDGGVPPEAGDSKTGTQASISTESKLAL
jgi:hypothetical protein